MSWLTWVDTILSNRIMIDQNWSNRIRSHQCSQIKNPMFGIDSEKASTVLMVLTFKKVQYIIGLVHKSLVHWWKISLKVAIFTIDLEPFWCRIRNLVFLQFYKIPYFKSYVLSCHMVSRIPNFNCLRDCFGAKKQIRTLLKRRILNFHDFFN